MKKIFITLFVALMPVLMLAQGWPSSYGGVMLQGFYWDSYTDSRWTKLASQADELSEFFNLVWIPQSASCGGYNSMGYDVLYWFNDYNSSFGSEAQLRSLISIFADKGIGTIADVVINHRKSINDWVTFPAETYNGVTYQLKSTDICKDDDGGETLTWATANGVSLSSNNDSGEDWAALRDLDHSSSNVQTAVKAYTKMLLDDFGYAGFRYDMTKGYSPSYTGIYNNYAQPTYSVGEYWDGNLSAVKSWIDGTKVSGVVQSAAFDFPFRYAVRDAVNNNVWTNLSAGSLSTESSYRRYSVTFVENHDTQYRSDADQDPLTANVEAANAYMMAMPGTPCVFLPHWTEYKEAIKQMIYARQLAGVTNTSATSTLSSSSSSNYFAQRTTGSKGYILAAMGSTSYSIPSTYVTVLSGTNYRLALSKSCETAWASKPSGEYESAFNVTLTAVSATSGAKLVYTLDGTEPTASNGTTVSSGTSIAISSSSTLKVGLLKNGSVSGVITRTYELADDFEPYTITVYLKDPTVSPNNWSNVYFYCWDSNGSVKTNSWPGTKVTATTTVRGDTFYYMTFNITSSDYSLNLVFNQGGSTAGSHQTIDVTDVNQTSYFEVVTQTSKYDVSDVTLDYTGEVEVERGDVNADGKVDISDVTVLIDYLLGSTTDVNTVASDVNLDGSVDISDVTVLIDYLLNGTFPDDPVVDDTDVELWYLVGQEIGSSAWSNTTTSVGTGLIPLYPVEGNTYNSSTGQGVIEYTGYFNAGAGFKLIKTPGSWDDQWGMVGSTYVKNNVGSSNIEVAADGFYTISLNTATDKLTITAASINPTVYTSISMPGDYQSWTTTSNLMTACSTSVENHDWYVKSMTFSSDALLKFAANKAWTVNWGGTSFPYGDGVQGGSNISVPAGTYNVFFNDITGRYNFISVE